MSGEVVEVVVVGAGQGGLGIAYYLQRSGVSFVVLERGRIGETWRSQRWDSFAVNTPNWINGLPGDPYSGPDPHGFMTHEELADSFEHYAHQLRLPIHTGVTVTDVASSDAKAGFVVRGVTEEGVEIAYQAEAVVVASGILQTPRIPEMSSRLPDHIVQLHTGSYRSPDRLPAGAVAVIGGGQSGAQIVEDLMRAGRTVHFAISKAPRVPRRYRGRDFMDWWLDMGLWDVATDDVDDPETLRATNPLVSGLGRYGHTVSFQQLARDGAHLMGRLEDIENGTLVTDDRVIEYVRSADDFSANLRHAIDRFISESGIEPNPIEEDAADDPLAPDETVEFSTTLDLAEASVSTVIWATGFTGDFSWLALPVFNDTGHPVHHRGVAELPGVYFIGFPWLSKRKSGVVLGIDEDAQHVTEAILSHLKPPAAR